MTLDLSELPSLLEALYAIVSRLEEIAPGRKFTPDGHLVGSIGEAVAAYAYGLQLLPASVRQYDAVTQDGRFVQIKLTQGKAVALSYKCDYLLVLQFDRKRGFIEIFNGPGDIVWQRVAGKADEGRQRPIRLSLLAKLRDTSAYRIPQVSDFPAIAVKA